MMDQVLAGQNVWNEVLEVLEHKLAPSTFEDTFISVRKVIKEDNGTLFVLTPNQYIKHKINNTYFENIKKILADINSKYQVRFVTEDEIPQAPVQQNFPTITNNNLNLNYTFESFVVGGSNRTAYLTALKVADNPGILFNPFYIFGGVGLGKTHLMQAIGNFISLNHPDYKILYIQANDYLTDFIKSNRDHQMSEFENKYSNIDVLLLDDIQMLKDKNATQEAFFNLFNTMSNNKKQIIITSDRPANMLNGFVDRLTSRFQMGIFADMKQPDYDERIKILRQKVLEQTTKVISDDIIEYIAKEFSTNVRELEGALNRVLMYSDIYNQLSLEIAVEALDPLIKSKKQSEKKANYEDALSVIADMYNVTVSDILSSNRNAKYVLPRHICMYILKTKYKLTYSKIGNILNGRDHTTVMNGCTKIEEEIKNNEELEMAVDSIIKKL
jgi:chromosomal replication initiator protein